jgi:hypothetical protein
MSILATRALASCALSGPNSCDSIAALPCIGPDQAVVPVIIQTMFSSNRFTHAISCGEIHGLVRLSHAAITALERLDER